MFAQVSRTPSTARLIRCLKRLAETHLALLWERRTVEYTIGIPCDADILAGNSDIGRLPRFPAEEKAFARYRDYCPRLLAHRRKLETAVVSWNALPIDQQALVTAELSPHLAELFWEAVKTVFERP